MIFDIINDIKDYLCFIDKFKLKLTCKEYSNIKLDFKEDFCNKLGKIIDDPQEFCNQMKINNTYIAGSFILDIIYGTEFSNDIDIYESDKNCKKYSDTQFSKENDILKFLQYIYTLDLKNNDRDSKSEPSIYEGFIYMIRNYELKKSGVILQHIILRTDKVKKFISNSFDLDICKNYFDGEKLQIKNLDKLLCKKDYIKPLSLLMEFYAYDEQNCGYTINRMNKYIYRGFDIKKHRDFDLIYKKLCDIAKKNSIITYFGDFIEIKKNEQNENLCYGDKFDIIMEGSYLN